MPRTIVAGNWKMNTTLTAAVELAGAVAQGAGKAPEVELILCPPAISLAAVRDAVGVSLVAVGAQNMHFADSGAFTGEIAPPMLRDLARYVILGHSERRQLFGETDELVNRKLLAALQHDLRPILCVGETLQQRESGQAAAVIGRQVRSALSDVAIADLGSLVVAYEPVWAIGTGRAATVQQAEEVHASLRAILRAEWADVGMEPRILYGGSVSPHNAREFFESDEINGALVGNACLEPEGFAKICEFAS